MSRFGRASARGGVAVVLLVFALTGNAVAATIVAGAVSNSVTSAPVAGATVSLRRGGATVAEGRSDGDGSFRLVVEVGTSPAAVNLTLLVSQPGFVDASRDVVIASGRSTETSYPFALLQRGLSECNRRQDHVVVIGRFAPPSAQPTRDDYALRVTEAINFRILTLLQQQNLPVAAQPVFVACGSAESQSASDLPAVAKALGADAFLSGSVSGAPSGDRLNVSIADGFGLFTPPVVQASGRVKLDDPTTARLPAQAEERVLEALVAGYERAKRPAECVIVAGAARRLLRDRPNASIEAAEKRCRDALPARTLALAGQR